MASQDRRAYVETFDDGPGGWVGWLAGGGGPRRLHVADGVARSQSPWGLDFNHAPPGAGYLQLPFVLMLCKKEYGELSGPNRFVRGGYSRDLTGARFTVRVRGEAELRGARLVLLVQADVGPVRANHVLTGQPIAVKPEWTEQTLTLAPDPAQWMCLGTRGEGADCRYYGYAPIDQVLRDVNIDLILALFPVTVVPAVPVEGDMHRRRAGKDYPVVESLLPSGSLFLDEVRVEWGNPG